MSILQDIFKILQEIKAELPAIIANTQISPNQVVIIKGLSELSDTLGLLMAGEFRSGNAKDPGFGFTGVRIGYPPFSYSSKLWHVAGISNDIIQFGLNADDGTAWAGAGAIRMTSGGILVYNGATQTGAIESDGDVKFGSNLSAAGTTSFVVFATSQTYNGESVGAGDILIGDNSVGESNLFWDASTKQLQFRTGTIIQAFAAGEGVAQIGVKVIRSTNQAITTDVNTQRVSFDEELYDDAGFWTISDPTKFTIPTGYAGVYQFGTNIKLQGTTSGTYRAVSIILNGDWQQELSVANSDTVSGVNPTFNFMSESSLEEGDYIQVKVQHDRGSDLNVLTASWVDHIERPAFWMRKVR